jgi:hypothetical protein
VSDRIEKAVLRREEGIAATRVYEAVLSLGESLFEDEHWHAYREYASSLGPTCVMTCREARKSTRKEDIWQKILELERRIETLRTARS